jgi:hypothetical protein
LLITFKCPITVNNIYYFDLSPGPYLVKNQIKHKRNFQNTVRCYKRTTQKSILSISGIKLKNKTTNIKDSPDLNITKNFTCKFWVWIKENIWVAPPRSKSKCAPAQCPMMRPTCFHLCSEYIMLSTDFPYECETIKTWFIYHVRSTPTRLHRKRCWAISMERGTGRIGSYECTNNEILQKYWDHFVRSTIFWSHIYGSVLRVLKYNIYET